VVSIHAPVTGATYLDRAYWLRVEVSIHAPVTGATVTLERLDFSSAVSIHAPVTGATYRRDVDNPDEVFQSTRP